MHIHLAATGSNAVTPIVLANIHTHARVHTPTPHDVSQLPRSPQRLVAVDEHAPALAADGAAAETGDDGLEAALAARVLEDGVVEGAGLQPDGGDPELLGLAQDLEGGGGRGDDGDGGLPGIGQGGEVGDGRVVLAESADGAGRWVDGRRGDVVAEVPGEDCG